jgi:hypothetical protein
VKKLRVVLLLALVAVCSVPGVALAQSASGPAPQRRDQEQTRFRVRVAVARLQPVDQSGIHALVVLVDTGRELRVHALAQGLDPNQRYVSLVYDTGSRPSGPGACEPTSAALSAAQMFVGDWEPVGRGVRTLQAVKTGDSYAPLSAIGTMSVRVVVGPPPAGFVLKACGRVQTQG